MKVLRYTLVAATVFVAAACGDKVTVGGPPTSDTAQRVNSVTVSPSSVTMNIGQSVTFSAIVDVSNGAAQTVTWSPTSGALSVSATGVATASAASAGVAVCATSTFDATKKGCAQAVVTGAAAPIPATVSIQSITVGCPVAVGTCGLNTPINPLAVTGNIDVLVNVSPGNETVSKVEVIVTNSAGVATVAGTQTFTAAQSAELRFAVDEAMANQSAFPPILFTINTAAFAAATGVPTWVNGNYVISVKLYVTGTTAARATATFTTPLAFVNANTYVLTTSFTGTTGTANSAAGFSYRRGSISISALPVIYTPAISMAAGTVTFGSALAATCDRSGTGPRAVALTAPVAPSSAWTGTIVYTPGSAAAAGDLDLYEYDATLGTCAAATLAVGEGFTLTATDNAGNAFLSGAAAFNAAANLYRVDNRPPVLPLAVKNPNGRQSGWINASVALTGVNALTATSNGWMVNGAAIGCAATDCGVGGYVRMLRTAASSAAGLVDEARLATASATPTLPAPSITNLTYCAVISAADLLGNESALPAAGTACGAVVLDAFLTGANLVAAGQSQRFGVDIAAPTIAYCPSTGAPAPCPALSMPANSRRSAGTMAGEFIVVVNDTGIVGNSGMLLVPPAVSPVGMRVEARRAGAVPNSAGTITCNDASGPTIPTVILCTALATSGQASLGAGSFSTTLTGTTGGANHAYYTHFATGTDAAGNSASVTPRVVVYDAAPPIAGTPSAPVSITATNFSASAFISEDLDIQDYSFGANYGANAPFSPAVAILQMPLVAVNGFNAAIFSNTNFGVTATVPLPLALQANMAAGLTTFATNGLLLQARAQSNLPGVSAANFIPGSVTPGTAIPLTNWATFPAVTLPAGVAGTVTGNTTAATAANPANVLLTATITGTTAIFNNPFSRMDFYMLDAPGARYYLVGTAGVATLNDNGATRTFTFTTTINGATIYTLLNGAGATWASNIVAVGIGAANGNVGMVAAANTALNVVF